MANISEKVETTPPFKKEKEMKYILLILTMISFVWAFMVGMDKEAVRQCEVAQAHCEQYGACSPVDLAVCNGEK